MEEKILEQLANEIVVRGSHVKDIDIENKIKQFEELLDSEAKETEIQAFLNNNIYFLGTMPKSMYHYFVISQPQFGSEFRADYAFYGSANYSFWDFMELEDTSNLFTKEDRPSWKLTAAKTQIENWVQYLNNNQNNCYSILGVRGDIDIIMGRRKSLLKQDKDRIRLWREYELGRVFTYDTLLEKGRNLAFYSENMYILTEALPFSIYQKLVRKMGYNERIRWDIPGTLLKLLLEYRSNAPLT